MKTKYGNLTGINRHLAKEKSHIFEEVSKFVSEFEKKEKNKPSLNESLYFPCKSTRLTKTKKLPKKTNISNLNIFESPKTKKNYNKLREIRKSKANFKKKHMRVKSNITQFQVRGTSFPNSPVHKDIYFQSSANLETLLNSQNMKKKSLKRKSILPRTSIYIPRKEGVRDSVIKQYSRLLTKNKNFDSSMTSLHSLMSNSFKEF
jgi:hypothetical protein